MPENKKIEQILTHFSEHKHSIRFNADGGPNNAIESIYLKRPFSDGAREIRITIEVIK